jgi:peroxiredoxin/uncharacterized membrane protein YphA (DoxX/SURF4 family)
MTVVAFLARLFLAAVFVLAAIAKLRDQRGTAEAITAFGGPRRFATPLAVVLPLVEFSVAFALLLPQLAPLGAASAALLLAAFTVAVAVTLAQGRRPDCHCFGQVASGPIGGATVVRNLALVALALVGLGDAFAPDLSTLRVELIAPLAVLAVVILESWLLLNLIRQNGRLLARIEALERRATPNAPVAAPLRGLPIGTTAPAFQLAGLRGETLTLESLRAADMPVLLTFSDPQCGPCNALMPDLGRWQREHASRIAIALISRGSVEANRNKASEHGVRSVLLQNDREIAERYLVTGTPSAVLVAADGTIASALAEGADAIASLVGHATGTPASVTGTHDNCGAPTMVAGSARLGDRAPAVRLPDLDGATRDLANARAATAVLFWNPSCGFCQQMLDQVKAWEKDAPAGAPGLLIVSTGAVEANRALGLRSTILLDQEFATARAFGATGTPSAVLVDAEGKIASLVGVGAPAVMSVLAPQRASV